MADQQQHDDGERSPLLPMTRQHLIATSGTLIASGVLDIATHMNSNSIFFGLVAAGLVAASGKEINDVWQKHMVPGGSATQVQQATENVVSAVVQDATYEHPDQSTMAKLRRLAGMKPAPVAPQPKQVRESDVPTLPPPSPAREVPLSPRPTVTPDEDDVLFEDTASPLPLGYVGRRRFDPPIGGVLGRGMLLAGGQGTGKSNIIGDVADEAGKYSMPELIIDFKGEFYPLIDVLPNGIRAGHPSAADEMGPGFFGLTDATAANLAEILMEGPFQVVIDLPSYASDMNEAATAIAALFHALLAWSRAMRKRGDEPWPCLIITDEAHNLVPERTNLSALAMSKESFALLTSAYSGMANAGRSYGYTLVMATQRLPNIAKWAIANLQVKIILAHAEKNDLDACYTETGGMATREEIKALARGTGIVIGLTKEPVTVKFDKQRARHVSNTPGVARLQEQFAGRPRPHLSRVLARRVPGTNNQYERVPSQQEDRPGTSTSARYSTPVPTQMEDLQPRTEPSLSPNLLKVYRAWQPGITQRPLAERVGLSQGTVGKLISELYAMGYIDKATGQKLK